MAPYSFRMVQEPSLRESHPERNAEQRGKRTSSRLVGADDALSCPAPLPSPPPIKRARNAKNLPTATATHAFSTTLETSQSPPKHSTSTTEPAPTQYQAGRPPTRKKKHGGSLTHLPLCNNQDFEKTFSEEELEQRRIESANYITNQILLLEDPGPTVFFHKGRIRDWRVTSLT